MNKPLTRDQVKEIEIGKPFETPDEPRSARRSRNTNENLVLQKIPLLNDKKERVGEKKVFHYNAQKLRKLTHDALMMKARKLL